METTKQIAIYNENCVCGGGRAWLVEERNSTVNNDVTWYDEADVPWAKIIYKKEPKNSSDIYYWNSAVEVLREFNPDFLAKETEAAE